MHSKAKDCFPRSPQPTTTRRERKGPIRSYGTNANNEMKESCDPPPQKKARATQTLEAPRPSNFIDIWDNPSELSETLLKKPGALFGSKKALYVRQSYIDLYKEVVDDDRPTQVINGTGGIGKSSFLLYALARVRCEGKPALLHFHPQYKQSATTVFFPADGKAISMNNMHPDSYQNFREWYQLVGEAGSLFLVDGIVSLDKDDVDDVKYVAANSPSCSLGFMEKASRRDRWLGCWTECELFDYAEKVGIPDHQTGGDIKAIIQDNMHHIGGVARYAFGKESAKDAIEATLSSVDEKTLLNVVTTGLMGKFESQRAVDCLIHRHPPPEGIGVFGSSLTFASEFVATKVSMNLALAAGLKTNKLLRSLSRVGNLTRGVLFQAYAARKIAEGGTFSVRKNGSTTEQSLVLQASEILQKDEKALDKTTYHLDEVKGKLVWPPLSQKMPPIDMFSFQGICMAFHPTVSQCHSLDIKGAKAFLKYFDSLLSKSKHKPPREHHLYFVVPAEIYEQFSETMLQTTGKKVVLETKEAKYTGSRITQWLLKVE